MGVRLHVPLRTPLPPEVRVEGAAFHHLRVLRVRVGDALELFDGRGTGYAARVVVLGADHALLALGPPLPSRQERAISVVQALPKGDKMEWVVQKGTELGAHAFHPAVSERTVVQLKQAAAAARRDRWQRIAEEAARQSGRRDVPAVHPVAPLLEAVRELAATGRVLILDEEERAVRLTEAAADGGALGLVVGPEGGLSREEVHACQRLGAVSVSLGSLTLRTETAAMAALAVLRNREGLLG